MAKEAVVEMARIAERERIGRDLHDLLGHTLSVIVLKSELAGEARRSRSGARGRRDPRRRAHLARGAQPRCGKRRQRLPVGGLPDELANAERVLVAAGVAAEIAGRGRHRARRRRGTRARLRAARSGHQRRPPRRRDALLDSASRSTDGRAVLEVRDDGRGGLAPEGSGLSGMRERLRQVAGTLERTGQARHAPARHAAAPRSGARSSCMIRVLIAEDQAMVLGALARAARHRARPRGRRRQAAIRHRGTRRWRSARGPTSSSPTSRCRGCPGSSWPPS